MPRYAGRRRKATRTKRAGSRKKAGAGSHLESMLAEQIRLAGLPSPERQAKLIPGRKFAHDLAWKAPHWLAVEVNGGVAKNLPSHMSVSGYERDCLKSALAQLQGYRTLAVTSAMVRQGRALALIEMLLRRSGEPCESRTPSA